MKNKIFTIDEPNNLNIDQVKALYEEFINPNQTKIFSSSNIYFEPHIDTEIWHQLENGSAIIYN